MSPRPIPLILAVVAGLPSQPSAQTVLFEVSGAPLTRLGFSVDGRGDANGDGTPDIAASDASGGLQQTARILSGIDGSVLQLVIVQGTGNSPAVVAFVGDVDFDGCDDWALGNPADSGFEVYSGATGMLLFSGSGPNRFGGSIAAAGDIDLDGTPDVIVGSSVEPNFLQIGGDTVRVVSGGSGATLHELSFHDPFGEPIGFGWSVAGAGDADGDGRPDLVIGTPFVSQPGGPADTGRVELRSGLDFSILQEIDGTSQWQRLGCSVAGVGDIDGDGLADFGSATSLAVNRIATWSGASGAPLTSFDLPAPPFPSIYIALPDLDAVGDMDGDGRPELLVGVPTLDPQTSGLVRLHSGAGAGLLFEAGDLQGWAPPNESAVSVAPAGDRNGDGREDLLVGNHFGSLLGDGGGLVRVLSGIPETWMSLGSGFPGTNGVPILSGSGTLEVASPGELRLTQAAPLAASLLIVGATAAPQPFKGGVLVPSPHLALALTTDVQGQWAIDWAAWPAGVPPYQHLWLQAVTADAGATHGASLSDALLAVAP